MSMEIFRQLSSNPYWRNTPVEFYDKVCQEDSYTVSYDWKKHLPICGKCGNPPYNFVKECVVCEQLFLKDFHHPFYCSTEHQCWDCVQKFTEVCKHDSATCTWNRKYGIIPPRIIDISRINPSELFSLE